MLARPGAMVGTATRRTGGVSQRAGIIGRVPVGSNSILEQRVTLCSVLRQPVVMSGSWCRGTLCDDRVEFLPEPVENLVVRVRAE